MTNYAIRTSLLCILFFAPALASASDNFTALLNIPLTVTGPDNQCRIVNNVSPTGESVYVPTNSILEWQSFVGHPPTGVTLNECPSPCPIGQLQIPDKAPGTCGKAMTVYSGYQYGNNLCGENIADIGRCAYGDPASVAGYTDCYYSFQTRGTCIEGYNCPYDGWTGWYDGATQAVSAECNNKTWDASNPGLRCVPVGQLGSHDCLLYSNAAPVPTQCSDGVDNDGNGLVDMADTCACASSRFDNSESFDGNLCPSQAPQCSNGIDDDGDGLIDMADTCGCSSADDTSEGYDAALCPWGDFQLSGTIICTELHRQGLMPDAWMQADKDFGHKMPAVVMNGYHAWARPVVSLMQRSHTFTMFVYAFAHPWAQEMAHIQGVEEHGNLFGIVEMLVGVPFSGLLGILVTPWW